jgi:F-type H+-transporting ATPase subunit b
MNLISYLLLFIFSEGGEKGGSPLDVNPGVILWTVVTFIFLLLILKRIAWKPILNSLKERESFIKNSLEKADKAQKDTEKLIADNKASLMRTEEEAQLIIQQSRELAEKLKAQILEESKSQAKKLITDATNEIERKNIEAFNKLKDQVADIAVNAAEKILRENLDKDKQVKLVNKYLDDLKN